MSIINLIKDYRKEFLELSIKKGFVIFNYEESFKIMKSENIRLDKIIDKAKQILHT